MRSVSVAAVVSGLALLVPACGRMGSDGTDSEVAASLVSGALNNTSGSTVGWNDLPKTAPSTLGRILDAIRPESTAYAATWSCTGGTLSPPYSGPTQDPYAFTPVSCTVDWGSGQSGSSKWSSTFTLDYGSSCDSVHPRIWDQAGGCSITRTTAAGGNTRTITGPDSGQYAVTHDTNGAGTGWDATVTPAPGDGGLVATCAASGCATGGGTLLINGSHLVATLTRPGGMPETVWDHTVSTTAGGITITPSGGGRVVSGSVTVQHNLARYTATTTFNDVGYGEPGCCFPTSGSVTTKFDTGPYAGKTETLSFSAVCGEATLTNSEGRSEVYTLKHCL